MASKKCQLKLGQKIHGPITMDRFKTTCPKWLGDFFMHVQNEFVFTKIYSEKNRNSRSGRIMRVHYGLYVVIELLLGFVGHGNVFVGLQFSEYEV